MARGENTQSVGVHTEFNNLYSKLLRTYCQPAVAIHGIDSSLFDYSRVAEDVQKPGDLFEQTLRTLKSTDLSRFPDANSTKDFWINVYNYR